MIVPYPPLLESLSQLCNLHFWRLRTVYWRISMDRVLVWGLLARVYDESGSGDTRSKAWICASRSNILPLTQGRWWTYKARTRSPKHAMLPGLGKGKTVKEGVTISEGGNYNYYMIIWPRQIKGVAREVAWSHSCNRWPDCIAVLERGGLTVQQW